MPSRAESLTFSQTSQLRLEKSLISSIYIYKLCNTTQALKDHVFTLFGPYSAFYKTQFSPIKAESLNFSQTS